MSLFRGYIRFLCAPFLFVCVMSMPAYSQFSEEDDFELLESTEKPTSSDNVDASQVAKLIIERTNDFREKKELEPVEPNQELNKTAQYFADYMARTDRYGHGADDQRPSERAKNHGYEYCIVSENIGYQYNSTGFDTKPLGRKFVQGWKNSPEHRKNMLNSAVTETGVAVAKSEKTGHWYAVQMFGRPKSAAIEFRITNESESDVSYSIGDRSYELPPRYIRTHTSCRPAPVKFDFPENEEEVDATVEPSSGDQYTIVRADGELEVQSK
ncbi:MAG: serine protease [Planctomyces sp.]|nr:serine protease [Planctomyces sp.]